MTILQAVLLGVIQGLTEFLPVSSSGHLVLAEHLLDIGNTGDITFEVFLHFGTLLSVAVVFWNDIVKIIQSLLHALVHVKFNKSYYNESEPFRIGVYIVLGSIPAGVIGILFEHQISDAFTDPKLVATMLVVTGLILFLTRLSRPIEGKNVSLGSSILVGFAQAVAVIPGISRSGSTMSTALYCRVSPVNAARFSFLLAVPVIFGATLLKTKELMQVGLGPVAIVPLIAGTLVAFVSGYFAIKLLLKVMERGKFRLFAFYCFTVGVLGIIFL